MNIKQKALKIYTAPFTYRAGWIRDANNVVASSAGRQHDQPLNVIEDVIGIMQVRGWGHIQYIDLNKFSPEDLQDQIGEIICEALNDYWDKHAKKQQRRII